MERVHKLLVVAMLMVAIASNGVLHVSYAQTIICNISVQSLMACKPAVTQPNPTPPTSTCCSALSHADMTCLCTYKNSQLLPSLGIDPKLALQLPVKCKLPRPNC